MKGYVRRIEMVFGFHPHKYIPLHNQELISANVKAEATAFWIFMHSSAQDFRGKDVQIKL